MPIRVDGTIQKGKEVYWNGGGRGRIWDLLLGDLVALKLEKLDLDFEKKKFYRFFKKTFRN